MANTPGDCHQGLDRMRHVRIRQAIEPVAALLFPGHQPGVLQLRQMPAPSPAAQPRGGRVAAGEGEDARA